jgi:hypothetical protein
VASSSYFDLDLKAVAKCGVRMLRSDCSVVFVGLSVKFSETQGEKRGKGKTDDGLVRMSLLSFPRGALALDVAKQHCDEVHLGDARFFARRGGSD